jgi:hypothetical protein
MVNYCEDGIFAPYPWEACDQVHGYLLEWAGIFQGADLVKGGLGVVDKDFVLLAGCTSLHIPGNPVVHSWPGEMSLSLLDRFILPGVACGGVVVD